MQNLIKDIGNGAFTTSPIRTDRRTICDLLKDNLSKIDRETTQERDFVSSIVTEAKNSGCDDPDFWNLLKEVLADLERLEALEAGENDSDCRNPYSI